jgi:hypothetical protein
MSKRGAFEDELFALPLDEFTAARDKLAADLKKDDAAAAARVKKLRKPSVAAWAVNQLARRHSDAMEKLLALREEMDDAGAAQLRFLGEKRRRLLADLVKKAEALLQEGGHGSSAATLEKVTQTLQAGATEEEVELLRNGTLTRELSPSGFEGFAFSSPGPAVEEPSRPSKATERARAKADELAAAAEEREAEARELEKAAEITRKHAAAAARQAEVARRNADRARERAEAAVARLD